MSTDTPITKLEFKRIRTGQYEGTFNGLKVLLEDTRTKKDPWALFIGSTNHGTFPSKAAASLMALQWLEKEFPGEYKSGAPAIKTDVVHAPVAKATIPDKAPKPKAKAASQKDSITNIEVGAVEGKPNRCTLGTGEHQAEVTVFMAEILDAIVELNSETGYGTNAHAEASITEIAACLSKNKHQVSGAFARLEELGLTLNLSGRLKEDGTAYKATDVNVTDLTCKLLNLKTQA